jgi:hypothetical protein
VQGVFVIEPVPVLVLEPAAAAVAASEACLLCRALLPRHCCLQRVLLHVLSWLSLLAIGSVMQYALCSTAISFADI